MNMLHNYTVLTIADWYVAEAVIGTHKENGTPKAASTMYNERRVIKRSIDPHLGNVSFSALTHDRMQEVVDWTAEAFSVKEALVVRGVLKNLCDFAIYKGISKVSTAERLKAVGFVPSKTILSDEAFRTAWMHIRSQANDGMTPTRISAHALLTQIATLQPAKAVVSMRSGEVDIAAGIWRKPASSGGRSWIQIPLSARSICYVVEAQRLGELACGATDFVFPAIHRGYDGEKPIDEKTPAVMMRRTGRLGITPQDFVDTAEAWLTAAWVHPTIVRVMVGKENLVADPELLSDAVAKWGGRLTEILRAG